MLYYFVNIYKKQNNVFLKKKYVHSMIVIAMAYSNDPCPTGVASHYVYVCRMDNNAHSGNTLLGLCIRFESVEYNNDGVIAS